MSLHYIKNVMELPVIAGVIDSTPVQVFFFFWLYFNNCLHNWNYL